MKLKLFAAVGLLSLLSSDAFAAMTLEQYRARAEQDSMVRCYARPPSYERVKFYIDYAYQQGLITERASYWGKAFGYYPVIDYYDGTIAVICGINLDSYTNKN
ncbi:MULTISPECIES: hypothetical protein [Pseudoalteromonas]|uniref:Uncharacterized protein n=1 Tax=Pseudoalteromonas luteoviolacea (strain 2ta16) TaxID=1353533 RepID=V4HQY9_PSEL2|nr:MULTISPECIES: hypothetical protein [Pseudoalteromonas]ESP92213.1 hypothetical protein PL2TA16_05050 [Pseudoalteromonas luteoviolacea 2ta16]MCG7549349.1 hypothetical protein [Pseudoalteromonas sp. Of7M-16]